MMFKSILLFKFSNGDFVLTAKEICSWFISRNLDHPTNTLEGNTKLQKLLFFSWLIHKAKYDKALFNEDFYAFPNGPVVEPARSKYRYSYSEIASLPIPEFSEEEKETLQLTEELFGSLSSEKLADLSHNSGTWKKYNDIFIKEQKCNPDAWKPKIPKEELEEELMMINSVLYAYENMLEDDEENE